MTTTATDPATLADVARHALIAAGLHATTWIDEHAGVAYVDATPAASAAVIDTLTAAGLDTGGTRRVTLEHSTHRPELHRIPLLRAYDRMPLDTV